MENQFILDEPKKEEPKEEKELTISSLYQSFDIPYNNKVFSIEISVGQSVEQKENEGHILFKGYEKSNVTRFFYSNSFNMKELLNMSKAFKICDDINEIFTIIQQKFKDNEILLTLENDLTVNFELILPNKKIDRISLVLKKEKLKESELIEKLFESMAYIIEKNKALEEQLKNSGVKKVKKSKSFVDIMSKKFKKSNIYLLDELFKELKRFDCTDEYRKEILDKFQLKTKTIYNANKDEDTIGCFISKVFGKKNLAAYFSFHCFEDVGFGGDFVYLDGKLEFEKDYLTFLTNNVISYGTYEQSQGFGYKLFRNDNAKIFMKVEKDRVYFIVYGTYEKDKDIRHIIKINEHFIKNPIIIGDHPENTSDYDNNKMIEWLENGIMEISEKKNVQEKSEKKEKEEKVPEFYIKELKIYQIDN